MLRPAADLRAYCQAQGGQWKVLQQFNDDPLSILRRDPITAFLDAHLQVTRHLQSQGAAYGQRAWREMIASDVGEQMAQEALQNNRRVESLFSAQGFRYAQRLDAFGLFGCEQATRTVWFASVLPATLIARDGANQLDSSAARLSIRTYVGVL